MTKGYVRYFLYTIVCGLSLFAGPRNASAVVHTLMVPNLKALPAEQIQLATDSNNNPLPELRFSTLTWNAGRGPMELRGVVPPNPNPTPGRQPVKQRIYFSDTGFLERLVGSFIYHPAHHHTHFDGYAAYTLQSTGIAGIVRRISRKVSFCLVDSIDVDLTLPGAPTAKQYQRCDAVFQGISVGWGDRYGFELEGQSFDLTGVPRGDYRLSIRLDPENRLSETSKQDNTSCVLIHLETRPLAVTVLNPDSCGPLAPILDNLAISLKPGQRIPVKITGKNFTPGMSVRFTTGSGPAPVVTNVVVVNSTTITASVAIRNFVASTNRLFYGRDPRWDLRVGSAVVGYDVVPNALRIVLPPTP